MYKVLVLMSTYNGEEKIRKQVVSIFNQKDVDAYIYIRDDGSNPETILILKELAKEYCGRLYVSYADNIGWKQSFLELVYTAEATYDYYAFSDQDDIWFDDKIITCIHIAEQAPFAGPKLVHCNAISVTPDLQQRSEQEIRTAEPPSFEAAVATEYFQGCGMLWNRKAMCVIQKYKPHNRQLAHDYWVGLICYLTGKVYFCSKAEFYHIRYDVNSSEDGNRNKGRIKRLKKFLFGKDAYMNPAQDILIGYPEFLKQDERDFLKHIVCYKENFLYKLALVGDRKFVKPSLAATLLLKLAILSNKF